MLRLAPCVWACVKWLIAELNLLSYLHNRPEWLGRAIFLIIYSRRPPHIVPSVAPWWLASRVLGVVFEWCDMWPPYDASVRCQALPQHVHLHKLVSEDQDLDFTDTASSVPCDPQEELYIV